jgi:hypothetical protein
MLCGVCVVYTGVAYVESELHMMVWFFNGIFGVSAR